MVPWRPGGCATARPRSSRVRAPPAAGLPLPADHRLANAPDKPFNLPASRPSQVMRPQPARDMQRARTNTTPCRMKHRRRAHLRHGLQSASPFGKFLIQAFGYHNSWSDPRAWDPTHSNVARACTRPRDSALTMCVRRASCYLRKVPYFCLDFICDAAVPRHQNHFEFAMKQRAGYLSHSGLKFPTLSVTWSRNPFEFAHRRLLLGSPLNLVLVGFPGFTPSQAPRQVQSS